MEYHPLISGMSHHLENFTSLVSNLYDFESVHLWWNIFPLFLYTTFPIWKLWHTTVETNWWLRLLLVNWLLASLFLPLNFIFPFWGGGFLPYTVLFLDSSAGLSIMFSILNSCWWCNRHLLVKVLNMSLLAVLADQTDSSKRSYRCW